MMMLQGIENYGAHTVASHNRRNIMRYLFMLVVSIFLFNSNVQAEDWVPYDPITKRVINGRFVGDGYKRGICGLNNSNIISGWIWAKGSEYQDARGQYKKVNLAKPKGQRIVDLPQAEIDVIVQAQADAQAQAILDQIDKYEVSNIDLITALIKRINVRIPSNPIPFTLDLPNISI